jgi:hypothetical protein
MKQTAQTSQITQMAQMTHMVQTAQTSQTGTHRHNTAQNGTNDVAPNVLWNNMNVKIDRFL